MPGTMGQFSKLLNFLLGDTGEHQRGGFLPAFLQAKLPALPSFLSGCHTQPRRCGDVDGEVEVELVYCWWCVVVAGWVLTGYVIR